LQSAVAVVHPSLWWTKIKAAAKERFIRKLGVVSAGEMKQIKDALATLLNLD